MTLLANNLNLIIREAQIKLKKIQYLFMLCNSEKNIKYENIKKM